MSAPLYELMGAEIVGPEGRVLEPTSWSARDRAVTVFVGPAATGKSTLLRALAGAPFEAGFEVRGEWRLRGAAHRPGVSSHRDVYWVRQPRRFHDPLARHARAQLLLETVQRLGENVVLLLDEPSAQLEHHDARELAVRIRSFAARGGAVVVTHDLELARAIADDVALLCAGRLAFAGPAKKFFAGEGPELVRQFLKQGNCWPRADHVDLPKHFHWILPSQLAGMGRPGLLDEVDDDLTALATAGVDLLVSLTEDPFPANRLRSFGIAGRHFPIPDMGVPAIGPTASLCRDIVRAMQNGQRVALHCHAGLGRTGTMLAAVLVWRGQKPHEAAATVRAVARGYIQTDAQLDFLRRFAEGT